MDTCGWSRNTVTRALILKAEPQCSGRGGRARAGFLAELCSILPASWCAAGCLGAAWLDGQPSESLSGLLAGGTARVMASCLHRRCSSWILQRECLLPPTLFNLFMAVWLFVGLSFTEENLLACPVWDVLNQKLTACELFATDKLFADFFLLLVKCLWIAQFLIYTD